MADGFDISELDKVMKNMMETANDTMPKESKKFLKKEANKLKTVDIQVFKSKGIGDETGTGNLVKGFKSGKVYKYNGNYSCRAYNSSPHAHLLDRGWMHKPHKGEKGEERFVPGYHFMEDAEKKFQGTYYEDCEDLVYTVIEKLLEG